MNKAEILTILTIFLAVITLTWRIFQNRKQFRILFFIDYTKRYHGIFINLPLDIYSDTYDITSLEESIREDVYRWIRAYFDLCSEEHYMYTRKLVDNSVWELWKGGMQSAFNKPAFIYVWDKIHDCGHYHPGFVGFVKSIQNSNIQFTELGN